MSDPTVTLLPHSASTVHPPPIPALALALSSTHLALLLAHTLATVSVSIANSSTHLIFALARIVLGAVAGGCEIDAVLRQQVYQLEKLLAGPISTALSDALNRAESAALSGIALAGEITKTVLELASSGVAQLEEIFGAHDALQSLGRFWEFIDHERGASLPSDPYDVGGLRHWSMLQVVKACATWGALQSATKVVYGSQLASELHELTLRKCERKAPAPPQSHTLFDVTGEHILSGGEELIEASVTGGPIEDLGDTTEEERTRLHLRQFSRIAMASYGGKGVLCLGLDIPKTPSPRSSPVSTPPAASAGTLAEQERGLDEAALANAFSRREKDYYSTGYSPQNLSSSCEGGWTATESDDDDDDRPPPSLWRLLSGAHDTTLLEGFGCLPPGSTQQVDVTDSRRRPPRFFIITDHSNRQVVVCLRGTMSLDDVATDCECEVTSIDTGDFWDACDPNGTFLVHGGMLRVALAVGRQSGPLTSALNHALTINPGYSLALTGHSLGAGIAALLGIMWTSPTTGQTSRKCGLPKGREVRVYGFAPPCSTDTHLSRLCKGFIHSFVLSSDAVPRFSHGHCRDIRSTVAWICYAEDKRADGDDSILSRVLAFKHRTEPAAEQSNELAWLISLRKTLEANMTHSELFPPGDVLWLVNPGEVVLPGEEGRVQSEPRLFRISGRVDIVFKLMLLNSRMLVSHLPHKYMQAGSWL